MKRFDRPLLNQPSIDKLNRWLEQTRGVVYGRSLSGTEIINWLIESYSEQLSEKDLKDVRKKFFDPIRALEHAAAKAKAAVGNGEELNLLKFLKEENLIGEVKAQKNEAKIPREKRQSSSKPTGEMNDIQDV